MIRDDESFLPENVELDKRWAIILDILHGNKNIPESDYEILRRTYYLGFSEYSKIVKQGVFDYEALSKMMEGVLSKIYDEVKSSSGG